MKKMLKSLLLGLLLCATSARADYVGELETTKYFDQPTVALIQSRMASGGLKAGDEISYFIQFTPTDNGGLVGGGGFVTDYIPAGTQVVGAQFVRLNGDGSYSQISPPGPAAMLPYYVPFYSDTGIFYSTDPRTAMYTLPASPTITSANGYANVGNGCKGISLPSTTHNAWDNAMVVAFEAWARNKTGTCALPPATTYDALTAVDGQSPVAGPDTYLTKDSTGAVGPWQRIAYPGSYKGTKLGVASYGGTNKCIGGVPTSAGYALSSSNPLPPNTTAVRFAAGKVTVGELFSVRISLKLTADMPVAGIVNNSEVFGGDASLDPGSAAGKDNHWKYHCPAVAVSNSNLLLLKRLVGVCTGVGCAPTPITAGVVPNAANLKLRYEIQYLNLAAGPQTNLILKDTQPAGAAYVAASYVCTSAPCPGAPTAAGTVLTFPTLASLGAGAGGTLQYDINFAAAPGAAKALINTANLTSTQVPAPGVSSKSIATASTLANLWIAESTSTPSRTSGEIASYTITIPNNGGTPVVASAADPVTVKAYLPTGGLGVAPADHFHYFAGSVVAQTWTAAGVATAVTPTVLQTEPATAAAKELVTFTLTAGTIPVGGKLTLTFNATVGGNVPASATPYLSDAQVWYSAATAAAANSSLSEAIGVAPVTVTAPMTLALKVDCIYAGVTCVPFANGTIPPGSKVRYRFDYKNISATTLSNLTLTDTLPANTTYQMGTTQRNGTTIADPTVGGAVLTGSLLTFPTLPSLAAGVSGYTTFDVQLEAAVTDGMDITNSGKLTALTFAAGVTASVTTSVRNQAELTIVKTVSPSTAQAGGTVTYTVTVTNIGSVKASNIKVYDLLPYSGTVNDSTLRFNYAAAGSFTLNDTATPGGQKITAVAPTFSVPPSFVGYTSQTNRQQIMWDFASAGAHANDYLSPGMSFTFTYTATVGSMLTSSASPYTSDAVVEYISATTPPSSVQHDFAYATAPVTIGGLHHILITHDGNGLTCTPSTVKITACANVDCTAPHYAGGVSVTLTPGGQTFTIDSTGENNAATVAQTTAGPVNLAVSATTPSAQTTATCSDTGTSTASCSMTFADAGFILSDAANGNEVAVPLQTAGVTSASYVLRAVKADKTTQACVAALTGSQTVGFGYECNDHTSCATGNLLSVNGTPVQSNNNNPLLGYSYTNLPLTFDSSGNSTTLISFSYEDVGQVTLRMLKAVNGKDVSGNSNAFVVKPDHLAVDVCSAATVGDCSLGTAATASDGTAAVLAIAGTDAVAQTGVAFKTTVRAMSANGNVTPSFKSAGTAGGSNATETVTLSATCAAPIISPATTCSGGLTGTVSVLRSSFSGGVMTIGDLAWSEVGAITMKADNASFLGQVSSSSTGTSAVAGRFRPHHFDTVVAGPMGCASGLTCPAGGMAYSGQSFTQLTVTAKNAAGATTSNYKGGFAKAGTLSAVASSGGASLASTGNNGGILSATALAATDFTSGVATLTTTAPAFTFAQATNAPLDVFIHSTDGEAASGGAGSSEGGLKVVSGRIKVGNAYGSDKLGLTVPVTIQYYDGALWKTSATDGVTQVNTKLVASGGNLVTNIVNGLGSGVTVASPGLKSVVGGVLQGFRLNAPHASGVLNVSFNAPVYLPTSSGQVTFGVYKGTNEMIYLRESY